MYVWSTQEPIHVWSAQEPVHVCMVNVSVYNSMHGGSLLGWLAETEH